MALSDNLNDPLQPASRSGLLFMRWKGVIVLGICFMLVFTSFLSLQNLQSSIHSIPDLGLASLAVIYASFVLSALFIAATMQIKLGYKWTIVVSIGGYAVYVVANFWPSWWTIVPASFVAGASAGPLWAAMSSYLSILATNEAPKCGSTSEDLNTRFFGAFFVFFQSGHIWGNLLASLVLKAPEQVGHFNNPNCGIGFCHQSAVKQFNISLNNSLISTATVPADSSTVTTLLWVFLVCTLTALVFGVLFLDNIGKSKHSEVRTMCSSAFKTISMLRSMDFILVIPLTLCMGYSEGVVVGSFTEAFVSCRYGVPAIGYVMIAFGVSGGLASVIVSNLTGVVSRMTLSLVILPLQLVVIAVLIWWPTIANSYALMICVAAAWAIPRYGHKPILLALYSVAFSTNLEAAFSNFYVYESIGFTLAFTFGIAFCFRIRLYLFLGAFVIASICYLRLEAKVKRRRRRSIDGDDAVETPMNSESNAL